MAERIALNDIAKMLDHSTLQPYLTEEDIRKGCDIALKYNSATVCARPGDMPLVSKLLSGSSVLPSVVPAPMCTRPDSSQSSMSVFI